MIKRKLKICIGCGFPRVIFSNGRCEKCARLLYAPMQRQRTRIAPFSVKRKKENVQYSALRLVFLTEHPTCEAMLTGCTHIATQVHHKAGRIGKLFLDITKWLASCDSCHKWIELHPEQAKEMGLSLNRLQTK